MMKNLTLMVLGFLLQMFLPSKIELNKLYESIWIFFSNYAKLPSRTNIFSSYLFLILDSLDGKSFHIRTLSMLDRPYGVEINRRYKAKDVGVRVIETLPKNIYTYPLKKN
jgi:hypothetical protein